MASRFNPCASILFPEFNIKLNKHRVTLRDTLTDGVTGLGMGDKESNRLLNAGPTLTRESFSEGLF